MNQEIKQLEEERQKLLKETQVLDVEKNKVLTRIIEIQGIIRYLKDKESIK